MEETYRLEKKVMVFSVILGIVVILSMLSFFGVIGDGPRGSFGCTLPKHFECQKLTITPTSVDFDVTYNVAELVTLNIKPETSTTCQEALTNGMMLGNTQHISIKCGSTAKKGEKYKLTFEVKYQEANRLERIEQGSIKGKVS